MAIFIEDFERTENSDELFGIIGRALVIATRFDSMCKTLARAIDLKPAIQLQHLSDADFDTLVSNAFNKLSNLNKSVGYLKLPKDLLVVLQDAQRARNAVAHDLAVGLEGCIDTKVNESALIRKISDYMFDLVHGEVLISALTAEFNGDKPLRTDLLSAYKDQIIKWVVEK